jgi:rhodanese-related sulfurtransferase
MQDQNEICLDSLGRPAITILDLRTENFLQIDTPLPAIKTECQIIRMLFDNLSEQEKRNLIPQNSLVVSVSETGNRDAAAIRYLSQYGFSNIVGLRFGMRDWIKRDYPVAQADRN